jgi:hypothetical protein
MLEIKAEAKVEKKDLAIPVHGPIILKDHIFQLH